LSLTFGVAFATLLVVAGILAGPAVLDCSHQGGGLGACLRGKAIDSGLLPARDVPANVPTLVSSATPELPTLAEAPHEAGWIEANATEYEAPPPDAARLQAPDGTLNAGGGAAGAPSAAVEVALVEPGGRITAGGAAQPADDPVGHTDLLADPGGGLHATGSAVAVIDPASTTLAPARGIVSATGSDGPAAAPATGAAIAPMRGTPLITGSIGRASSRSASALLEASLVPIVPSLMPPLELPLVGAPPPVPARAVPAPAAPKAAPVRKPVAKAKAPARPHRSRAPAIKYDPHYPNVLVLPPPNSGEDSSFATLEVR
jgi:hypothetical protein